MDTGWRRRGDLRNGTCSPARDGDTEAGGDGDNSARSDGHGHAYDTGCNGDADAIRCRERISFLTKSPLVAGDSFAWSGRIFGVVVYCARNFTYYV